MPDAHGDRATHDQHVDWTARKRTALRRPTLDCGHRNAGEVFYHAWCDRLSCSDECANAPHDCSAFAGVKSGIEEEPEPVGAAVDLPAPNGPPVATGDSSPAARRQFIANTLAFQRALTHPRCSTCARFTAAPVDRCTECERVGSAPNDRVADAMRAEVLRQGLTECEIDGVRQEYRDGQWSTVATFDNGYGCTLTIPPGPANRNPALDRPMEPSLYGRTEPDGPIHTSGSFLPLGSRSIGETWARTAGADAYWPEPVAPHVDESLDGTACSPAGASPQGAVTSGLRPAVLKSEIGSRLASEPRRPVEAYRRSWWSRLFPGRSTR